MFQEFKIMLIYQNIATILFLGSFEKLTTKPYKDQPPFSVLYRKDFITY